MLVGATTENPYFEVNSALISRTQVYELQELTAEDIAGLLRRALDERRRVASRRGDRVPGRALGRRRALLVERAGAGAGHRGAHRRAGHAGRRRGRDAAQGAALRQVRRPALRLHLGLDQVHPRVGPRRVAVLPGGDARGRRGPALHRPPDGDLRLRGRRQRRPARAAGGGRRRARGRARRAARVHLRALAGGDLPLAGAEVQRGRQGARRRAGGHPRARRQVAAGGAALGGLPRVARARPRASATTIRTTTRATSTTRSTCPAGASTCASIARATPSPSCASAWPRDPRCPRRRTLARSLARRRRGAQPLWSLRAGEARARYIRRAAVALLDELEELALRLAEETGLAAGPARADRDAARRARAAGARRRGAARAGRPADRAACGAAGRPRRGSCSRRSASSGCAGRPRRRGPSRRSRPPPRCWPATACCWRGTAGRSGCAPCSCARACRASCSGAARGRRRRCRRVVDLRGRGGGRRCSCSTARRASGRRGRAVGRVRAPCGRGRAAGRRRRGGAGARRGAPRRAAPLRVGDPATVTDVDRCPRWSRSSRRSAVQRPAGAAGCARRRRGARHRDGDRDRRAEGREGRCRSGRATRAQGERVARRLPSASTWVGRHGVARPPSPADGPPRRAAPAGVARGLGAGHAGAAADGRAAQRSRRCATGAKRAVAGAAAARARRTAKRER